jgi:hypothetical protein
MKVSVLSFDISITIDEIFQSSKFGEHMLIPWRLRTLPSSAMVKRVYRE